MPERIRALAVYVATWTRPAASRVQEARPIGPVGPARNGPTFVTTRQRRAARATRARRMPIVSSSQRVPSRRIASRARPSSRKPAFSIAADGALVEAEHRQADAVQADALEGQPEHQLGGLRAVALAPCVRSPMVMWKSTEPLSGSRELKVVRPMSRPLSRACRWRRRPTRATAAGGGRSARSRRRASGAASSASGAPAPGRDTSAGPWAGSPADGGAGRRAGPR